MRAIQALIAIIIIFVHGVPSAAASAQADTKVLYDELMQGSILFTKAIEEISHSPQDARKMFERVKYPVLEARMIWQEKARSGEFASYLAFDQCETASISLENLTDHFLESLRLNGRVTPSTANLQLFKEWLNECESVLNLEHPFTNG